MRSRVAHLACALFVRAGPMLFHDATSYQHALNTAAMMHQGSQPGAGAVVRGGAAPAGENLEALVLQREQVHRPTYLPQPCSPEAEAIPRTSTV